MAEERGLRPGETGDAARAVEPGTVSRLLLEIALLPADDVEAAWREALRPGDEVGRYQIRREIGRGGFGAVYEAFDPQLGRTVALKALKPGRTRRIFSEEWIQKEAEAVAKLDHPAIVTIFDVGTCPAGAYLVMELLQGETLAERLARGTLPVDEALRVAEQMAEGLAHAHGRGVLHRDLKPANAFLCADGRVKLLDFGLAHLLGTDGSSGAGTPAYMAPEQAAGAAVDERADVYAAAMVLGEMVTGRRPVERATPRGPSPEPPSSKTELMWESEKVPPVSGAGSDGPKLDGVPRPVARVLKAALSANPADRPKDGGSWLAELRSARSVVDRPRRLRRLALVGTAFLLLGLAVAGLATWRIWERQIPGGRPTVAVADFANETGDSELDGISGLLITSLEQGSQLRVLTRGRMLDILRQQGKQDVTRIDEPLAREVGLQARANALLLATVRRLGDTIVVEMRALDPLHDEYVFTAREQAATKAGVFGMVDRLGATVRRRLGGEGRAPPPETRIAAITTASPRAWDLYFQAVRARDEAREEDAARLAQEALAEDPGFTLARFMVLQSRWGPWGNNEQAWSDPDEELQARKALEEVEATAERLPEKERLSLRAMRASLERQWTLAGEIRDRVAALYPLDKEAVFFAGYVRFYSDADAEAMPYFRKALQLDPGFRVAAVHLARSLTRLGRAAEEVAWLRAQVQLARSDEEKVALLWAFLSAGQEGDARRIQDEINAREGVTGTWPALALYWVHHGRAPEAERAMSEAIAAREARSAAKGKPPMPNWRLHYVLAQALLAQGRLRDAEAHLASKWPVEEGRQYLVLQARQWAVSGQQDHARLEETTREIAALSSFRGQDGGSWLEGPKSVIVTAMADRFDLAAPIARTVLEGGAVRDLTAPERAILEAVLVASESRSRAAPPALVAIAEHPQVWLRFPGSVMLGHYLRTRGDCPGAIAAYERARAIPWHWLVGEKTTHFPFVLHCLTLCYDQVGDLARARERNAELLQLWVNADPGIPLHAEAKAMQTRLAVK